MIYEPQHCLPYCVPEPLSLVSFCTFRTEFDRDSVVTIVSKSVKLAWGNEWDSCLSKKPDRMNGDSDDNKYISYIHIWCSHLSFHMFAVSAFPQHV